MYLEKVTLRTDCEGPPVVIHASQGESGARSLELEVLDKKGTPLDFTGCFVLFYVVKGSSEAVQIPAECSGTSVRVVLTFQAAAHPGDNPCWLQIIGKNGEELRVDNLILRVKACGLDEAAQSTAEFGVLTQLMLEARQTVPQAGKAAQQANEAREAALLAASEASSKAKAAGTAANAANAAAAQVNLSVSAANTAAQRAENAAFDASLISGPLFSSVTLSGEWLQSPSIEAPWERFVLYGKTREFFPGNPPAGWGKPADQTQIEGIGQNGAVTVAAHGRNCMCVTEEFPQTAHGLTIACDLGLQYFTLSGVSSEAGSLATLCMCPHFWNRGDCYTISVERLGGSVTPAANQTASLLLEGADESGKTLAEGFSISVPLQDQAAFATLSVTPEAEKNARIMKVRLISNAGGIRFEDYRFRIQVEKAKAPSLWEPFRGSMLEIPLAAPLYSLPDGSKDVLEKRDGQWGISKCVGSVVCDGSAIRASFAGNEKNGVFQFNVKPPKSKFRNSRITFCDRFRFVGTTSVDGEAFIGSDGSLCFYIDKKRTGGAVSTAAANLWMQNHPVFALYPLPESFDVLPQSTQRLLDSLACTAGENIIHNSGGAQMQVTLPGAIPYLLHKISGGPA